MPTNMTYLLIHHVNTTIRLYIHTYIVVDNYQSVSINSLKPSIVNYIRYTYWNVNIKIFNRREKHAANEFQHINVTHGTEYLHIWQWRTRIPFQSRPFSTLLGVIIIFYQSGGPLLWKTPCYATDVRRYIYEKVSLKHLSASFNILTLLYIYVL